jgi:hypothetical protein
MNRIFGIVLAAVAAAVAFAVMVYAVLVVANVSEPTAATVQGLTARRLWATASAMLALVGVLTGGLALARPVSRVGGAMLAMGVGFIGAVNGSLNLALADGGPGTGNGVVGGAAAFVLGAIAVAIGALALVRSRRPPVEFGRT